jgi:hypothetical protein
MSAKERISQSLKSVQTGHIPDASPDQCLSNHDQGTYQWKEVYTSPHDLFPTATSKSREAHPF